MTHDFLVGPKPLHDGGRIRLGLQQLEASEALLKKLLAEYQQDKTQELAWEITQECSFLSQMLDSLTDMTISQPGPTIVVSGALLKVSRYLHALVEKAEQAVSRAHIDGGERN